MKRQVYKLIPKAGSISNLKCVEEEMPELKPDEVTVEVMSIGLNFADVASIHGLYRAIPDGSFIPGLEYAGVIAATGSDAGNFKTGDRIMGITRFGGYVNRINIPWHYVIKIPDDWSYEEGASYPVHALTAYYALVKLAGIKENQTILIHSAAGGVGIMANRLAKRFHAFTIGTIGNPNKAELLKKEGYDEIIVRNDHFREDLKNSLGGNSLNIVLDSIGGQVLKDSFRLLSSEGRLIVFGSASFMTHGNKPNYFKMLRKYWKRPLIDPMRLPEWNKSVMGFNLIYLYEQREDLRQYLAHLEELDLGKPFIGHRFHFAELPDAVKLLQSGKTTGKVIVNSR